MADALAYDYILQMMVVGNSEAGKTAFLERYCNDVFIPSYIPTVGVDSRLKSGLKYEEDKNIKLRIWDTAGQECYQAITSVYYPSAMGFIVMFDLSDEESFSATKKWFEEIHKLASENTPIVLVGNKSDLVESRVITREQGVELAQSLGVEEYYFETSVKDNVNVSDTIEKLTELMWNKSVY